MCPALDPDSGKVSPVNWDGVGSSWHVAPELGGSPKVNSGPGSFLLKAEVPTCPPGMDTMTGTSLRPGWLRTEGLRSPLYPWVFHPTASLGPPESGMEGGGTRLSSLAARARRRLAGTRWEFGMGGNQESPACLV